MTMPKSDALPNTPGAWIRAAVGAYGRLTTADRILIGYAPLACVVAVLELVSPHSLDAYIHPEAREQSRHEPDAEPIGRRPPPDFRALVEQPLFTVNRKPYEPPPERPVPEPPRPAPQSRVELALSALITTPTAELALVTIAGSPETHKLRLGESVEGWILDRIGDDSIELRRGTKAMTLTMAPEDAIERR